MYDEQYMVNQEKYNQFYFFWDHDFLDQWVICNFTLNEITFNCAEQYMMYQKALLMNDNETANQILNEKSPSKQKALGRSIKNWNQEKWDQNKIKIVFEGNNAKFRQNTELRKFLLNNIPTNVELVEASPEDCIWGIGLSETDDGVNDKKNWKGLNLLGRILTKIRDYLLLEEKK
ncbi:hypothetical protein ABK040_011356 [Willaertia magna]